MRMPRNEAQNKLIRDERREQILNAALRIFALKGLAATKISEIAAAASLSHGLVYHYFKSKEEIFIEVVRQTVEMSNTSADRLLLAPGKALDKIRYLTRANINYNDAEENAFRWLVMIQAYISDVVPQEVKQVVIESSLLLKIMKELIITGQKEGEIVSGDPSKLSTAILSTIPGLVFFRNFGEDVAPMPNEDMIIRMLKA